MLQRVEETDVNSSQYMTDLDGILTDGGEFKSKERAKMKRAERSRKTPQTVKKDGFVTVNSCGRSDTFVANLEFAKNG